MLTRIDNKIVMLRLPRKVALQPNKITTPDLPQTCPRPAPDLLTYLGLDIAGSSNTNRGSPGESGGHGRSETCLFDRSN